MGGLVGVPEEGKESPEAADTEIQQEAYRAAGSKMPLNINMLGKTALVSFISQINTRVKVSGEAQVALICSSGVWKMLRQCGC